MSRGATRQDLAIQVRQYFCEFEQGLGKGLDLRQEYGQAFGSYLLVMLRLLNDCPDDETWRALKRAVDFGLHSDRHSAMVLPEQHQAWLALHQNLKGEIWRGGGGCSREESKAQILRWMQWVLDGANVPEVREQGGEGDRAEDVSGQGSRHFVFVEEFFNYGDSAEAVGNPSMALKVEKNKTALLFGGTCIEAGVRMACLRADLRVLRHDFLLKLFVLRPFVPRMIMHGDHGSHWAVFAYRPWVWLIVAACLVLLPVLLASLPLLLPIALGFGMMKLANGRLESSGYSRRWRWLEEAGVAMFGVAAVVAILVGLVMALPIVLALLALVPVVAVITVVLAETIALVKRSPGAAFATLLAAAGVGLAAVWLGSFAWPVALAVTVGVAWVSVLLQAFQDGWRTRVDSWRQGVFQMMGVNALGLGVLTCLLTGAHLALPAAPLLMPLAVGFLGLGVVVMSLGSRWLGSTLELPDDSGLRSLPSVRCVEIKGAAPAVLADGTLMDDLRDVDVPGLSIDAID